MRYPFPGNVRELENLIEGALALTVDPIIDPGDLILPEGASTADGTVLTGDLPSLEELNNRYIARVLAHTKGNMSAAAKILGIDRKTLYRKREELSHLDPSGESWDVH
jgi:two-component system response regulator HydG